MCGRGEIKVDPPWRKEVDVGGPGKILDYRGGVYVTSQPDENASIMRFLEESVRKSYVLQWVDKKKRTTYLIEMHFSPDIFFVIKRY